MNICIMGIPEEEGKNRAESLFREIVVENVPNLGRDMGIQIHEAQIPQAGSTQEKLPQDT